MLTLGEQLLLQYYGDQNGQTIASNINADNNIYFGIQMKQLDVD